MRVGRSNHPRYGTSWSNWMPPTRFRDTEFGWSPNDPYDKGDAPEWFDLADFPNLNSGEWREVDTWPAGRLGLFVEETDPLDPVVSDGHRTGLEFENERYEMTRAAVPMLTAFHGGVTWHTEFPYGWAASAYSRGDDQKGRTDVVVCAYDWDVYAKRQQMVRAAALNEKWGYLKSYRWIRDRGPVTHQGWLERGPYRERYLKEIWRFLSEKGFLATNGSFGGYYTVMPLPDHIEAHAIELKQSNWKEALEQVVRAEYADYQWVALDAGHLRAARENTGVFREHGVGLLGVARGGVVELVPAEQQYPEPDTIDRMDLRERSVGQLSPDDIEDSEPDETEDAEPEDSGPEQAALGNYA